MLKSFLCVASWIINLAYNCKSTVNNLQLTAGDKHCFLLIIDQVQQLDECYCFCQMKPFPLFIQFLQFVLSFLQINPTIKSAYNILEKERDWW